MIKKFTILLTTVILSGCVAVPKKDATGGISEKSLYFPKENQKTYVVSGGIAHLKTAYKSGYRFKLKAPITKSVQMGLATVSIGRRKGWFITGSRIQRQTTGTESAISTWQTSTTMPAG